VALEELAQMHEHARGHHVLVIELARVFFDGRGRHFELHHDFARRFSRVQSAKNRRGELALLADALGAMG